jgi:Ca2+-binding RTX toxin-like protein
MATAEEQIGTLHSDYSDYPASGHTPTNFADCLVWNLMELENANYVTYIHAVRADNSEYTATMGYGLDIDRYGAWDRVRALLVYGLTGTDDDINLTQTQRDGLDILAQYKNRTNALNAQDISRMAQGLLSDRVEVTWTQAQANAVASLNFTQEQAELVLRAMLFGDTGGVTIQQSYVGDTRRLMNQYGNIEDFTESTELVALTIMRYRGDLIYTDIRAALNNNNIQDAYSKHAESWWQIIERITIVPSEIHNRLKLNARMFGVLPSDVTEADHENVLKAMSLLCREHLTVAFGNANIKQTFLDALKEGKDLLKNHYTEDNDFDVVQLANDSGETLNPINAAVADNKLRDLMVGGKGNDTLNGGAGDDYLYGNEGNDTLNGEDGNDTLTGGLGNDTLKGGKDNDTYIIEATNELTPMEEDIIEDTSGTDKIIFKGRNTSDIARVLCFEDNNNLEIIFQGGSRVTINDWYTKNGGRIEIFVFEDKTVTDHEIISYVGTDEEDYIRGTEGDNKINGKDGDDVIEGGGGKDTIYGGSGNDKIYAYYKDKDNITDQENTDKNTTNYLYGEDGDDEIYGDEGKDIINGGNGNDTMYGNKGDDTILGGDGDDVIYGGEGNDTLSGDKGDDTLDGGEGKDRLVGGQGFDTYVVGNGDTINDSDGQGRVYFMGTMLTKGKLDKESDGKYKGDGGEYSLSGSTLTFKKDGNTLTIENYSKEAESLGIKLEEEFECECGCGRENCGCGHCNDDFCSPLVLDLNNNEVTSTIITDTHFDVNGDGFKEKTAWVEKEDGLLVLDKNQNGIVDDGSELFGNNTKLNNGKLANNGFDALKEYDLNKDGAIDNKDSIYNHLHVWVDANADGITDNGELKSLNDLGISSINLNAKEVSETEALNKISHMSSFIQNGEEKKINDVWFLQNGKENVYVYDKEISADILSLPELSSSGRVLSLRESMNDDETLKNSVTTLIANTSSTTYAQFIASFKSMMARWTKTDHIKPNQIRGAQNVLNHNYDNPMPTGIKYMIYAYALDVAIVEAFTNKNFSNVMNGKVISDIQNLETSISINDYLKDIIQEQSMRFLTQTIYGEQFFDGGLFKLSELLQEIQSSLLANPTDNKTLLLLSSIIYSEGLSKLEVFEQSLLVNQEFKDGLAKNGISYNVANDGKVYGTYGDTMVLNNDGQTIIHTGITYGGAGNDVIRGGSSSSVIDVIDGGDGDDIIYGNAGNDILKGGDGNDTIYAGSSSNDSGYGHDIIEGGRGDDTIYGTGRDSTFVYNYGDGYDTIIDSGNVGPTGDTLRLNGILTKDVKIDKSGNDIIINIIDIEDGSKINGSITIKNALINGKIETIFFADTTLNWEALIALDCIDTKNLCYVVQKGDANRIITPSKIAQKVILQGIYENDIIVTTSLNSNDLTIVIKKEGKEYDKLDKIVFRDWFTSENRINSFVFGNETVFGINDILKLQVSSDNDFIKAIANKPLDINAYEGDDTVYGSNVNDMIEGSDGNDAIYANDGNDTLKGGKGGDYLEGGNGNDTYIYARGDGKDTILDTSGNSDTLEFREGITKDDLIVKAVFGSDDLVVAIKEDDKDFNELSDVITLKNWFNTNNRIEYFTFANGITFDANEIIALQGITEYDDHIKVGESMTINTLGGNDIVEGSIGNDAITGGKGNDILNGAGGNDTYIYSRGDGTDTIYDNNVYRYSSYYSYTIDGGKDTLKFGEGIAKEDLIFKLSSTNNDLVIILKQEGVEHYLSTDKIIIKEWKNRYNRIETIEFYDGMIMNETDIINYASLFDDESIDDIIFVSSNATFNGQNGNDTYFISNKFGKVTIYDSYVVDNVEADGGNDTLLFADEINVDDLIFTTNGNNLLIGLKEEGKSFNEFENIITICNWFYSNNKIENFIFSNGSKYIRDDIFTLILRDGDVHGSNNDDTIIGTLNDDAIYGEIGNDIINGGKGSDALEGGQGDDTYVYGKGDGKDTIYDDYKYNYWYQYNGGNDTLEFKSDITKDDLIVKLSADSNDLIIAIKEDGKSFYELTDVITIKEWLNANNRIENFKFNDGTVLDVNDIINLQGTDDSDIARFVDNTTSVNLSMGDGDDIVQSGSGNDIVNGGQGNDTIYGGGGNDTTYGDDGDDIINGEAGNDTLMGGKGNDTLEGGQGDDTYMYGKGDGKDTIYDDYRYSYWSQYDGGNDTLEFKEGITKGDLIVKLSPSSNDLIIAIKEDGKSFDELSDVITIKEWLNANNRIENFKFSDGTILNINDIVNLQGTDEDDIARFVDGTTLVNLSMGDGDDIVQSGSGDDTIYGDDGDDIINSGDGNDIIDGGKGDDTLEGNGGDDTYVYGRGDGKDTIYDDYTSYWYQYDGGNDTLEFKEGITKEDLIVKLSPNSNDLIVAIKEDGKSFDELSDVITIKDWFNVNNRIENFKFSDGTVFDVNDIINLQGTDEDDVAVFVDNMTSVNLSMGDGDDIIQSGSGDDIINGDNGDDIIASGDGNDVIEGGKGDDTLKGGKGDDTYIYSRGDGKDIILDTNGNDTLKFKEGITKDDLIVRLSPNSNDLIVAIKENGKSFDELSNVIIIKEWLNANNRIEKFLFSDGTTLYTNEILGYQETTDGNDYLTYLDGDMSIEAKRGDDTITGNYGNTKYIYGRGDGKDTITDFGGSYDEIVFRDGITQDNIIIKVIGSQTIVAIKEEGKSFDELSDKIILTKPSSTSSHGIEKISFSDGTSINPGDFIGGYLGTEHDDNIDIDYLQSINPEANIDDDFAIDLLDGYDTVTLGNGNNVIMNAESITLGNGSNVITNAKNIGVGDGNNVITYDGDINNVNMQIGDGDNDVLVKGNIGDMMDISLGDGNNNVNIEAFVGEGFGIEFGNGNNKLNVSNDGKQIVESYYDLNELECIYAYEYGNNFYTKFGDGNNIVNINGKLSSTYTYFGDGDNVFNVQTEALKWNEQRFFDDGLSHEEVIEETHIFAEFGNGNNIVDINCAAFEGGFIFFGDGDNTVKIKDIQQFEKQYEKTEDCELYNMYIGGSSETSGHVEFGNGNNNVDVELNNFNALGLRFQNGNNVLNIQLEAPKYSEWHYSNDGSYYESEYIGYSIISAEFGNGNNILDIDSVSIAYLSFGDGDNTVNLKIEQRITEYKELEFMDNNETGFVHEYYNNNYNFSEEYSDSNKFSFGDGNNIINIEGEGSFKAQFGNGDNTLNLTSGFSIFKYIDTLNNIDLYNEYISILDADFADGNNTLNLINVMANLSFLNGDNIVNIANDREAYIADEDGLGYWSTEGIVVDATHYLNFQEGFNTVNITGDIGSSVDITGSTNTIIALTKGDDSLYINNSGENKIFANLGNDTIYSQDISNDIYEFGIGDGEDRITDCGGIDKIVFKEGITKENIKVSILKEIDSHTNQENFSLVIAYGENDRLILSNWFNQDNRIESFEFEGGITISDHEIVNLIGTNEGEFVLGTEGNNTLDAKFGDDIVNGGLGNDTYIFAKGYGRDTLEDSGGFDEIRFGENIVKDDIVILKEGNDLHVYIKEEGKNFNELSDSILIKNWFSESGMIERLVFANGESVGLDELLKLDNGSISFGGTSGDDELNGSNDDEVLVALEGDDIINASGGDDILLGQDGNDTLDGGEGNDILYGGDGNDTYIIRKNAGNDTIVDSNGDDRLLFEEGILFSDLTISFDDNDLIVELEGTRVTLQDWYFSENRIESFEFEDGTILSADDLQNLSMTDSNDIIKAFNEGSKIDTLDGDDKLIFGLGDDEFKGGNGDDTYYVNFNGKDKIFDVSGIDTIVFDASINKENLKITWIQGSDGILLTCDDCPESSIIIESWYNKTNRIENFVFSDGSIWNAMDIISNMGTNEDDVYNGLKETSNIIVAKEGNDIISTFEHDDIVYGNDGDDTLDTREGDDYLEGGAGNDLLIGGSGDDAYVFEGDFGHDVIKDDNGVDAIIFGADINKESLRFYSYENDTNLYIGIYEEGKEFEEFKNTITIQNWYKQENTIENILFTQSEEILSLKELVISENDGVAKAYEEGGALMGTDGDDYLIGGSSQDEIYGLGGDDTISGEDGDDMLDGGNGNDFLNAGKGDDLYIFGYGYGEDIIYDYACDVQINYGFVKDSEGIDRWTAIETPYGVHAGTDTVFFSNGITKNDLILANDGLNLIITLKDSSDKLTIKGFYDENSRIEKFHFEDGSMLSASQMEELLFTDGDDDVTFIDNIDRVAVGKDGDDIITTGSGNDIVDGGEGDDILDGGFGDDVYVFGRGYGHDEIVEKRGEEWWQDYQGNDRVLIVGDVTEDDLIVKQIGDDLIIAIKEEGKEFEELNDTLIIKNYSEIGFSVENVEIENEVISISELLEKQNEDDNGEDEEEPEGSIVGTPANDILYGDNNDNTIYGKEANDIIYGKDGNDTIYGNEGNDMLFGQNGDDTIYGNLGNDIIYADNGNDTIEGGEGNDVIYAGKGDDIIAGGKDDDILYGEDGDDTYLFSVGDGRDIINDNKGINSILFDEGINKDNISLYVKGNTLNISYSNNDSISATIDSIETIRLNDGSYLTSSDIELIIQNINAYANDNGIQITSHDDIKNSESLMQIVSSRWNG